MPRKKKKAELATLMRWQKVARRYLEGATIVEIAQEHGVSERAIYKDLEKMRESLEEAYSLDLRGHLLKELARLDNLERQAWDDYRKSAESREEVSVTFKPVKRNTSLGTNGHIPKNRAKQEVKVKTTEAKTGNPKFMAIVLDCIEKRCRLLGFFRNEITDLVQPIEEEDDSLLDEQGRLRTYKEDYKQALELLRENNALEEQAPPSSWLEGTDNGEE